MEKNLSTDINKNRYEWVDIARGYCILCVMLGHMEQEAGILRDIVYSFHLPMFFMLSGFLFHPEKYELKVFVKKKIKGLLIPYFFMGSVIIIVNWCFYYFGDIHALGRYIYELVVQNRFHTIWYLTCLFCTEMIFYFIARYVTANRIKMGILIVEIAIMGLVYYYKGGQPLPWNVDVCTTALLFFYVGYMCQKIKLHVSPKYLVLSVIASCVCIYINLRFEGHGLEMFGCEYAIVPCTFIASVSGAYIVYCISNVENKLVSYIGKHSMVYFGWHQAIPMPAAEMIYNALGIFVNRTVMVTRILYMVCTMVFTLLTLTLAQIGISHTRLKAGIGE